MAKTMNHTGAWFVLGTGAGVAIGTALDNVGIGVALGTAIGIAIGAAMDRREAERKRCSSERRQINS